MKILHLNQNYPINQFEDAYKMAMRIIMHNVRVETIYIRIINDPCPWMFHWPKNVYFIGCYFNNGIINPSKPVNTEYIHIRCKYNCKDIKINYEKFPKLKKIIIE